MGGLDMMLMQMFKNLGIDPQEIMSIVANVGEGVKTISRQQQQIIAQQRVMMNQLEQLGAKPLMLPQPEDIEDGNGRGSHGHGGTGDGG